MICATADAGTSSRNERRSGRGPSLCAGAPPPLPPAPPPAALDSMRGRLAAEASMLRAPWAQEWKPARQKGAARQSRMQLLGFAVGARLQPLGPVHASLGSSCAAPIRVRERREGAGVLRERLGRRATLALLPGRPINQSSQSLQDAAHAGRSCPNKRKRARVAERSCTARSCAPPDGLRPHGAATPLFQTEGCQTPPPRAPRFPFPLKRPSISTWRLTPREQQGPLATTGARS